jgi:hypothetical protein
VRGGLYRDRQNQNKQPFRKNYSIIGNYNIDQYKLAGGMVFGSAAGFNGGPERGVF